MFKRFPIFPAILAQILAFLLVLAIVPVINLIAPPQFMVGLGFILQALLAAGVSFLLRLQVWWLWIAALFPLALYLGLNLGDVPAWPFAAGFALVYLFFSNTARERVPLYLSNRQTKQALCQLMRDRGANRFIDLGCGFGGVVRTVAGDGHTASGVETAPMAFLIAHVLSSLKRRGTILRRDLWTVDLSDVDVVYTFLSPEPMPALYKKAKAEMKPGSLLVSNSFAVEGIEPQEVWELPDRRRTQLFLYRMG
jgi:hypothetical protein